jgi:hypothetical protein
MLALASENVRIDTRIICLLLVHYVNTHKCETIVCLEMIRVLFNPFSSSRWASPQEFKIILS